MIPLQTQQEIKQINGSRDVSITPPHFKNFQNYQKPFKTSKKHLPKGLSVSFLKVLEQVHAS